MREHILKKALMLAPIVSSHCFLCSLDMLVKLGASFMGLLTLLTISRPESPGPREDGKEEKRNVDKVCK